MRKQFLILSIAFLLIVVMANVGVVSAGTITNTLNSPSNGATQYTNLVTFNATSSVSGGATLVNMTLYTNESGGTWGARNTTSTKYTTSNISYTHSNIGSQTQSSGVKITPSKNIYINSVNKTSGTTATRALILDASLSVLNSTTTTSGTQFIFNGYPLTAGTTYYIVVDASGSNYVPTWSPSIYLPVTSEDIQYTKGLSAGTDYNDRLFSLNYINYSKESLTQTWTNTYPSGSNILWNVQACDSDGACGFAPSNYTFSMDSIAPTINVNYPTSIVNYGRLGGTLQLNWTATDTNLNSCWYNYNGTNISAGACSTGVAILNNITLSSKKNVTLYANDTAGNLATEVKTWDYYVFETSTGYSTPVLEGTTTNFTANLTMTSGYRLSSVYLIYNGTTTAGSAMEYSTDNWYIYATKVVPSVTTNTNYSWYWSLTFEDNSIINTTAQTQTVNDVALDNCSTYTNQLFNFTLLDEDTQYKLYTNSTDSPVINVDMLFKNPTSGAIVFNFSRIYSSINPARICSSAAINNSVFYVDAILQYYSNNRFLEFYHIDNFNLNTTSTNQNITLYDLSNSTGQEFKITYKNSNFNTVPGATIQIQRKYISEGIYKTVEIPKVGSEGYAIAHLIPSNQKYTFLVYEDGELLATFTDITPYCQNPLFTDCTISINSFASSVSPTDFTDEADFVSSISWNKTTRVVNAIFSVPSGAVATTMLNVTLYDGLGNVSVCSDTLTSAGGTLTCTIPSTYSNSTVKITLIADGVVKRFAILSLGTTPKAFFGNNLIFLGIIMILFFIGIGVSDDPKLMGAMLIIGVITLTAVNLFATRSWIGAGATILWFVVAVVVILIKGSDR
jgi:hypothetical protein